MTLEGKKTYITAGVLAVATFARTMGWLTPEQYELLLGLLGAMGLAALRAGVAKG
jgi:hypothetical protein